MTKNLQTLNKNLNLGRWTEIVAACRKSKFTVREWCKKNDIAPATYYHYQKILFEEVKECQPQFAEITLPAKETSSFKPTILISAGNLRVEIASDAQATAVKAVMEGLRLCLNQ